MSALARIRSGGIGGSSISCRSSRVRGSWSLERAMGRCGARTSTGSRRTGRSPSPTFPQACSSRRDAASAPMATSTTRRSTPERCPSTRTPSTSSSRTTCCITSVSGRMRSGMPAPSSARVAPCSHRRTGPITCVSWMPCCSTSCPVPIRTTRRRSSGWRTARTSSSSRSRMWNCEGTTTRSRSTTWRPSSTISGPCRPGTTWRSVRSGGSGDASPGRSRRRDASGVTKDAGLFVAS